MMCQWDKLLAVLPVWLRGEVDAIGKETMQELRLRINAPPELVFAKGSRWLLREIKQEDLDFCINTASRYSPWLAATAAQGYITAPGGHRIGICGDVVCKNGEVTAMRQVRSLCIRVARDFPGIAEGADKLSGSVLILGAPGWGKTTLLRDLCRRIGEREHVAVVDERMELFPDGSRRGRELDVLNGCPKAAGIQRVLRTMGPDTIAVDEITAEEDCKALAQAAHCGVRLLATAHGISVEDLRKRSVYRPLLELGIFDHCLVLSRDKSFRTERIT